MSEVNWKHAMQTYTGKLVNVMDPDPETIDIFDIAHHLALMTRFNGACRVGYSIAQHSVLCAGRAGDYHFPRPRETKLALALLMHDAAEAYVGDIIRTIKHEVPDFAVFENKVMDAINERFDLPRVAEIPFFKVAVKEVDNRMLVTEKLQLMEQAVPWPIEGMFQPYDMTIEPWTDLSSELMFLSTFARFRPDEVSPERVEELMGVKINA
jgi:hypothetical protein